MLDSVLTIFALVTIYFCLFYSFEEMNLFREKSKQGKFTQAKGFYVLNLNNRDKILLPGFICLVLW